MPASSTGMGTFTTIVATPIGLTTAFAGNQTVLNTHGSETAAVYVDYTNGSETSIEVQVEVWDAENGWFVIPYLPGTLVLAKTSTGADRWGIRRLARFETQLRISVRHTGSAPDATSALTVQVQLGHSRYPVAGNISS